MIKRHTGVFRSCNRQRKSSAARVVEAKQQLLAAVAFVVDDERSDARIIGRQRRVRTLRPCLAVVV